MTRVKIDGVDYVPVSKAHIDAEKIMRALALEYYVESQIDTPEKFAEACRYVRVSVTDPEEYNDNTPTIEEFVANISIMY